MSPGLRFLAAPRWLALTGSFPWREDAIALHSTDSRNHRPIGCFDVPEPIVVVLTLREKTLRILPTCLTMTSPITSRIIFIELVAQAVLVATVLPSPSSLLIVRFFFPLSSLLVSLFFGV